MFLRIGEQVLFAALPTDLKAGIQARSESGQYADSRERQTMRFQLLQLNDPILATFAEDARAAKSDADCIAIAQRIDLRKVNKSAVSQLLFALGPDVVGGIIVSVISAAADASDIAFAATLSELRHDMLESLSDFVHAR